MKDKLHKSEEADRSKEEVKRLKEIQQNTESKELQESIGQRLKNKDVKK